MLESGRYTVVARRHNELILSEPKTFRRYVYRELRADGISSDQRVIRLLQCRCRALLPVLQYQPDPQTQNVSTITDYYELTLGDVIEQRNHCDETELLNTLENVLQLLKELSQQNIVYGMMDKHNVCFHEGEIKLLVGNSSIPKEAGETEGQRDLRVLGGMMAQLAAQRPLLDNNFQELMKSIDNKYSQKFGSVVRCLCDPVPSRRQNVWKLLAQHPQPNIPTPSSQTKKQIENARSGSPKNVIPPDGKPIPKRPSSSLLVESNSQLPSGTDYNLQYFESKIQRIDDLVNECLKRSKRLIERSENRLR